MLKTCPTTIQLLATRDDLHKMQQPIIAILRRTDLCKKQLVVHRQLESSWENLKETCHLHHRQEAMPLLLSFLPAHLITPIEIGALEIITATKIKRWLPGTEIGITNNEETTDWNHHHSTERGILLLGVRTEEVTMIERVDRILEDRGVEAEVEAEVEVGDVEMMIVEERMNDGAEDHQVVEIDVATTMMSARLMKWRDV